MKLTVAVKPTAKKHKPAAKHSLRTLARRCHAPMRRNPQPAVRARTDGCGPGDCLGWRKPPGGSLSTPETAPILLCYDHSEGATTPSRRPARCYAAARPSCSTSGARSPSSRRPTAAWRRRSRPTTTPTCRRPPRSSPRRVAAVAAGFDAKPEVSEVTYNGTSRTILEAADKLDAALIVLGARGLSNFRSLLLGSVSHGVAQHAHSPRTDRASPREGRGVRRFVRGAGLSASSPQSCSIRTWRTTGRSPGSARSR